MFFASRSYEKDINMIQFLAFAKVTTLSDDKSTCNALYIGLLGSCLASCTENEDASCATMSLYKDITGKNCGPGTVTTLTKEECATAALCSKHGQISFAFMIIGGLLSIALGILSIIRLISDYGQTKKMVSFVLAALAFCSCVYAFAAFKPCAVGFQANTITYLDSTPFSGTVILTYLYPAISTIVSFILFVVVMFAIYFIPYVTDAHMLSNTAYMLSASSNEM